MQIVEASGPSRALRWSGWILAVLGLVLGGVITLGARQAEGRAAR
jgi:hypothetical protein